MDDVVLVTIVESGPNLPRKLARDTFTESTVADDVVEHLAAVDKLEDDVMIIWLRNDLSGPGYVWMKEDHGHGSFPHGADLFACVLGGLTGEEGSCRITGIRM